MPTTQDHSMLNPTPIPAVYSHKRRPTPSTLTRPSHQWSISLSMANEIAPYEGRSSDSTMHIKRWPTLQKTWQNLKGSTGICDGKNTTPSECWLAPMLINDSSHASSTMPPYPLTFPTPYLTQVSQTSPMGGNTARNTKTPTANGAHEQGTQLRGVPKSRNASSAMAPDILKHTAIIPTNIAGKGGSVMYPMTIPTLPTPLAQPMLGPSDDEKDVNKGVMSQETS